MPHIVQMLSKRVAWAAEGRPWTRSALLASLMVLALAGCRNAPTRTVLDLVEALPAAEKRVETNRIEFSAEDALGHLRLGWGAPELLQNGKTIAWAVERHAEIRFSVLRPGERILELSAQPFVQPDAGPQRTELRLNGAPLTELVLERGWRSYQIALPAALLRSGRNTLGFDFAYAATPAGGLLGSEDERRLAAAFDWIRLRSLDGQAGGAGEREAVRAIEPGAALAIDGAARVTYYFRAPESDAWLSFELEDAPAAPRTTAGRFDIRMRLASGRSRELYSYTVAAGRPAARRFPVRLPIAVPEGAFAGLELAASGAGEDSRLGLRLHQPRIEVTRIESDRATTFARPDLAGMNLAMVLMDAGAAGHYSLYGYQRDTSPVLKALAGESVVFERAFAEAPYTRAATASLFTGLYPEAHGAVLPLSKLPAWAGSLPERLKAAGFRTGGFIANGNVAAQFGFARGFDAYTEVMRLKGYDSYARSFWPVLDPWLDRHLEQRFFLYLHFREPHAYYLAPEGWLGKFSGDCPDCLPGHEPVLHAINRRKLEFDPRDIRHIEAQYDELIAWIDHSVGQFVQRLKDRGLWERTVLVVLSDHGEAFMEHGLLMHNYTVYDEMLRVVLMVRFPPRAGVAPRRITTRVGLIDVLPTLLDLFGSKAPAGLAGRSVAPLIASGDGAQRPRDIEVARTSRQPPIYGVFDDRDKYIVHAINGVEELYDLKSDPGERNDLANRRPLAVGFYRQELKRWYLRQVAARGSWESAQAGEIDANLRANLQALGYIGGGRAPEQP